MKVRYNTTAARAEMKRKLIRGQIDQLEANLKSFKSNALRAVENEDFGLLLDIADSAIATRSSIAERWDEIDKLREIIDAGTTHVEEPGDYA